MHFCWVFKDMLAEAGSSSEGYNEGRINLVGFEAFRWYASGSDEFMATATASPTGRAGPGRVRFHIDVVSGSEASLCGRFGEMLGDVVYSPS